MPTTEKQSNGAALVIRELRKSFADVVAVNGLNLEVKRGERFGLLGPNGAGKTTTIEICEGLISPGAGTTQMLGHSWRDHADELRQRLGIQLQETQFPEKLTVEEVISLFRTFFCQGLTVEQALTFSAIGLLIASCAKTMQAVSGLMNLTMLPMWILSGVFFSASRVPGIFQPFIRALPLTAAIDALRANILQGTPLAYLLAPLSILPAGLLITVSLSLSIFRWR